jgi:hypothetical protein
MVLEPGNARVPAKFLAKQEIAKPLKCRLLSIIKLCFETVPVNISHHKCNC